MKLMVIDMVCPYAGPIHLFIYIESENEDTDVFLNSDKAVVLLDNDSRLSPLSLGDDFNDDAKSEEDPNVKALKTIYSSVRAVLYGDAYIQELAIRSIDPDFEETSDMRDVCIDLANEVHMLNSERVILNDLARGQTVREYGRTLGRYDPLTCQS